MDTVVCVLTTWYRSNSVEDNLHIIKTNVKGITKCYKSLFHLNVHVIFVLFFYKLMFLTFIKHGLKNHHSKSLHSKSDHKFLLNVHMYKETNAIMYQYYNLIDFTALTV